MQLANELIDFLTSQADGASDERISQYFGPRYKDLVPVINELLRTNRIQIYTRGGFPFYRCIKEDTASKLDGLGRDQILVFQICQKAGNK
jgi:hypothetical protein